MSESKHVDYATTIRKFLEDRTDRHVLDVGACIGGWIQTWKACGADRIIAIEPTPGPFAELSKTHGEDPAVTLINAGVSDTPGVARSVSVFNCWTLMPSISKTLDRALEFKDDPPFDVSLVTIDDVCESHHLRPAFIKIDTDGYDAKAMRGAAYTIAKHRPLVMLEVSYLPDKLGDCCECMVRDAFDVGYTIQHFLTSKIYRDARSFMRDYPWDTSFDVFLIPE